METLIINKIEEISNMMLDGIKTIVRIDSVKNKPDVNAPYGKGIKKALDETLSLARLLGLDTVNIDNHIGYASLGISDDYVCAVGHLDVVSADGEWDHQPFSGYSDGKRIFARGILDNKGPILSCLYALYALKELGYTPHYQIRVIFGCDEESGFNDLKYYLNKEKPPIYGFTPDCKYPVVYSERGSLQLTISSSLEDKSLFCDFMNAHILNDDYDGKSLGINYSSKEYGCLKIRNYKLFVNKCYCLQLEISYPPGISSQNIIDKIKFASKCLDVTLLNNYDPVIFDLDSFIVKELRNVYEKMTKMDGTPVTTTGGTYAKIMPNIVPFGPSFPGQKGISHLPNEWMNIEDIVLNAKIYALGLYKISKGE